MENSVGVIRGEDKITSFKQLLELTQFTKELDQVFKKSGKSKSDFKIIIKPNMMVYVNKNRHTAVVTDKEMVEHLVDHCIGMGFKDISVCEAQNDVGRMLQNHTVDFVSDKIGYRPNGRYKIVDLTLELEKYKYTYNSKKGKMKKWKDSVGRSWKEADFRISFSKCKTHEHDYMTLCLKNVYGCFPDPNKCCKYHIRREIEDVTSWSIRNFPVHFSFVDAWIASDGFQGYKIPYPQDLKMLFGGPDIVAVDMEVFKRAGLDPAKSRFIKQTAFQLYDNGNLPGYIVKGDTNTLFTDIVEWENISDRVVESIDLMEEVYIAWGFINLKPGATIIDYSVFPPKGIFNRFLVWLLKKMYGIFKGFKWFRRLYKRKKSV